MIARTVGIGETNAKTDTLQWEEYRVDGLTFHIPAAAGVTSCSNNRIVTLQEDASGNRYAVLHPVAVIRNAIQLAVIGFGVLENSLQSNGVSSIAPEPNTYKDGDIVTVLRMPGVTYCIDIDPANVPATGVSSCRVDAQGRLSSAIAGATIIQIYGAVYKSAPGTQMSGQLKENARFYMMRDPLLA